MNSFINGDKPPLVKPGKYELAFVSYSTAMMFGRAPKICLSFRIISLGEFNGVIINCYYNAAKLKGKPGKNGKFCVGWKSNFLRDFANLFNCLPDRRDRVPMSKFQDVIIIGKIITVTKTFDQKEIHPLLQYSVINELVGVKKI